MSRGEHYGKLQLMQQPSETRTIWHTRNDELDPSPQWGLSCLYEYEPTQLAEDKDFVRKLMADADLTPREEKVVHLCILQEHTLDETAKHMGLWDGYSYRERIRQIRIKAIRKLIDAAHKLT